MSVPTVNDDIDFCSVRFYQQHRFAREHQDRDQAMADAARLLQPRRPAQYLPALSVAAHARMPGRWTNAAVRHASTAWRAHRRDQFRLASQKHSARTQVAADNEAGTTGQHIALRSGRATDSDSEKRIGSSTSNWNRLAHGPDGQRRPLMNQREHRQRHSPPQVFPSAGQRSGILRVTRTLTLCRMLFPTEQIDQVSVGHGFPGAASRALPPSGSLAVIQPARDGPLTWASSWL